MQITWLGHSCFLLESEAGTKLLTDPPDAATGYDIEIQQVDAVTSSHAHHDHSNFDLAPGALRITGLGKTTVGDMEIEGFPSCHDNQGGKLRGDNTLYKITVDGLRILHAGDIGVMPDEETVKAIGKVDVLMVPIGGNYTLDAQGARELANLLHVNVLIPMHYMTSGCLIELQELSPLLQSAKDCAIHHMRQAELCLTPESLGKDRIIVLNYKEKENDGA